MPLYDLRCSEGHIFESMIPLAQFSEPIFCACGAPAQRMITAPMFHVENVDYTCPITDKWIGSAREHRDNLARHDCRVLETGEKEANEAFRASQDKALDAKLDETIERHIEALPSASREKLYNEMVHQDLSVTRN